MNGIDVSAWQPSGITQEVDYDFAIIKATEGTNYVSPACDAQYQGAIKRGKLVGVYHFALRLNPEAEANFFIENIKGYIGRAVLVLDWEADAIPKGGDWVRRFVKQVKKLTNVPPIIYGSASPIATHNIAEIARQENCGLWVAAYPNSDTTGYRNEPQISGSVIRQYSSTGRLDGYNGNLDLNRSILTKDEWKAYAIGGRGTKIPIKKPEKKSNDAIAHEVIIGKWGNGAGRVAKLKKAGYNYTKIQAVVNKLMSGHPQKVYVTVKSGPDGYLSNIANSNGTTVGHILALNRTSHPTMTADYVQAGWVIRVK